MNLTNNKSKHYSAEIIKGIFDRNAKHGQGTFCLLFGDYQKKDKHYMFSNSLILSGYMLNDRQTTFASFDYVEMKKFLTCEKLILDWTQPYQQTSGESSQDIVSLPNQSDLDMHYLILKKDCKYIWDLRISCPSHIKQRNIRYCKTCQYSYVNFCQCIDNAKIEEGKTTMTKAIRFHDIDINGNDIMSNVSLNEIGQTQKKGFIGFEWELGYNKEGTTTQKQTTQIFRQIKKQGIGMLNLFGETLTDSSISQFYAKGSEIPTHPFSFKYYSKYEKELNKLSDFANKSEIFGKGLGFHIHISRDCFSQNHLIKWLAFMTSSSQILLELSGRNPEGGTFQTYARLQLPNRFEAQLKKATRTMTTHAKLEAMAKTILARDTFGNKFNYLNFTHSQTIEYRLPASATGTSKENEFSKIGRHIELMFATHEYSGLKSIHDMQFTLFLDWLKKHKKYVNLYNSIVSNDRALNELIESSEYNLVSTLTIPNAEQYDLSNAEDMEEMESNFERFKKQAKKVKNAKKDARKIVKKHKGKIIKKEKK